MEMLNQRKIMIGHTGGGIMERKIGGRTGTPKRRVVMSSDIKEGMSYKQVKEKSRDRVQ